MKLVELVVIGTGQQGYIVVQLLHGLLLDCFRACLVWVVVFVDLCWKSCRAAIFSGRVRLMIFITRKPIFIVQW